MLWLFAFVVSHLGQFTSWFASLDDHGTLDSQRENGIDITAKCSSDVFYTDQENVSICRLESSSLYFDVNGNPNGLQAQVRFCKIAAFPVGKNIA